MDARSSNLYARLWWAPHGLAWFDAEGFLELWDVRERDVEPPVGRGVAQLTTNMRNVWGEFVVQPFKASSGRERGVLDRCKLRAERALGLLGFVDLQMLLRRTKDALKG